MTTAQTRRINGPYEFSDREYSMVAVALGVSHREALARLARPECTSLRYWTDELWDIDRAQRTLGLDNTQR